MFSRLPTMRHADDTFFAVWILSSKLNWRIAKRYERNDGEDFAKVLVLQSILEVDEQQKMDYQQVVENVVNIQI